MQTDRSIHRETLEEEATHATDEARMVLPGVQAVLGFQLVAVFNQRFELFSPAEQLVHLAAFVLVALAMGLMMTPAAYHRQVERGSVSRRFVDLSSTLLTVAMIPLIAGICLDTYLIARLILAERLLAAAVAGVVALVLASLWFVLPAFCRRRKA
jgi:uncharacterized membrane-anchored protein